MSKSTQKIVLIIHNIRSAHNVGAMLRSADGFGITRVYITGYSPYPVELADERLPHIARKAENQIAKTALGAEKTVDWQRYDDINELISDLKKSGYQILALEQGPKSVSLLSFKSSKSIALIVGSEVGGVNSDLIKKSDKVLQIPMIGQKDSFNVAVAVSIAFYHLRYAMK